jgi:hypothetical protein
MPPTASHRSLLAALALTVSVTNPAMAQEGLLGPGAAFISAGVARVATGELDDRLAANGYPTFGRNASSIGLGGYRVVGGHLMLGAELTGLMIGDEPHLGREVNVGGGHATLGIGYMTELSPKVRVYPRLGVGAGGLTLWIETADTVSFDDVLANPTPVANRERNISRDGAVFDLGGGLEFLPRGSGSGVLIGLRLGYLFTSFGSESNWQLFEGTATGGPSSSIAGPYLRVVIGGAWKR